MAELLEPVVEMTLNEYQKLAARTMNKNLNKEETQLHGVFGLGAEAGEVQSIFQKVYQGHKIKTEDLKKELGDVMWMVAEICTVNNWTMNEIGLMNIHKLMARYPDGFSAERSINREED